METATTTSNQRREALWVSGILGGLGVLWLVLGLYWQGALLVGAALILGYLARRRGTALKGEISSSPGDDKARSSAERAAGRASDRAVGKAGERFAERAGEKAVAEGEPARGKGRKRRR